MWPPTPYESSWGGPRRQARRRPRPNGHPDHNGDSKTDRYADSRSHRNRHSEAERYADPDAPAGRAGQRRPDLRLGHVRPGSAPGCRP